MQDHEKWVEQIQKKMAGKYMQKSQEQKKQQIFQYDQYESEFHNLQDYHRPIGIKHDALISQIQAEKSLEQIYNFYVNSYIQPRKHYSTFDQVNIRKLTFQPFILFMKHFKLLKTIYTLDRIKLLFKKYSNYGYYLTIDNFLFLINELAHEPEAKKFFGIPQQNVDLETQDQLEKQELYNYMALHDPNKYKANFNNVFEPFNCPKKPQAHKIKYTYRKFSLPELRKKALPHQQQKQRDLYVVKNKQQFDISPFEKAKSIVVSWDTLRSKSVTGIQQNSADRIKKKYVRNQIIDDDDPFLTEYGQKQKQLRKKVDRKIQEMEHEQNIKNKLILSKIRRNQQKTILKTSESTKKLLNSKKWK